jgi:hypothetical protein
MLCRGFWDGEFPTPTQRLTTKPLTAKEFVDEVIQNFGLAATEKETRKPDVLPSTSR